MPQFPPEIANLSTPNLRSWIPPRTIKVVGPEFSGNTIYLPEQPSIWYSTYVWSSNTFKEVSADTAAYYSPRADHSIGAHEPIRLQIEGNFLTDKTDYRSKEPPYLAEYGITRRIEYYLDGKKIITNVDLDTLNLNPDSIIVIYTATCGKIRLIIDLWKDQTSQTSKGPTIDSYTVHLYRAIHPDYR